MGNSPISAGDVLLIEYPPGATRLHFCIALCDQYGDPPRVIIVPVNTKTAKTDPAVVISPGEHPSISNDTCVTYVLAESLSVDFLWRKVVDVKQPLSPDLFERVLAGAQASKQTKNRIKRELREVEERNV